MPQNGLKQQSDEALAARAAQGDQTAFVALYDRHFAEVYDFLLRMLLSRSKAERAVLSAFVRLGRRLSSGSRRASPRLEALTAAYQTAIEDAEPSAARPADEPKEEPEASAFAEVDPNGLASPEQRAQAQKETPTVWEAASNLDRTEYALLDLHLRQRLTVIDVARVVGISRLKAWHTISSLKKIAEDALTSLLRLRLAGDQCPELQRLAAVTQKAIMPAESRREVSAHVAACPACSKATEGLVPALDVLAALLPVPPPPGLKNSVLQNLLAYVGAHATSHAAAVAPRTAPRPRGRAMAPPPRRPGAPPAGGGTPGGPAFPVLWGAAAAVVVPIAALAVWLGVLSNDGGNGSAGTEGTTTPAGAVATVGCGPPLAVGDIDAGTPPRITCTPTVTATPTPTPTTVPLTLTPVPTATATPSLTATATQLPTATPPFPVGTPVGEGTPLGVVETATPEPSPAVSPGPATVASPTLGPLPSPPPLPP